MVVLWFGTLCCDNFVMIWKCWEDLILASHCCTDFSEEFVQIDVSELRMQFLGLAIPRCRMISKEDILVPEPGAMFTCTCANDDGSICNKSFKSYVQLLAHMVHSRAGSHGERPVHALAAVTIACPWCKHKFASRCASKELSVEVHVGGQGSTCKP